MTMNVPMEQSDHEGQPTPTTEDFRNLERRVAELTDLLTKADMARTNPVATPDPAPAPQPSFVPTTRPRLPTPETFDGDKEKYPVWKRKVSNKMTTDAQHIGTTEQDRVNYIVALLGEKPSLYVETFLSRHPVCTSAQVIAYMDLRYKDAHLQQRAQNSFERLKMSDKEFPEFIMEAETLMSQAGIDLYEDNAKKGSIMSKLSKELRQLAVPLFAAFPDLSYDDFISKLHSLWNGYKAAKQDGAYKFNLGGQTNAPRNQRQTAQTAPPPQAPPPAAPDPMDWTQANKNQAHPQSTDARPFAQQISRQEFEARKAKNVCYTCGNAGHVSRQCYYQPAPRPQRQTRANVITEPPQQVMVSQEFQGETTGSTDEVGLKEKP
jgi:hypothetical protein